MRKVLLTVLVSVGVMLSAQAQTFSKGDFVFNATIGLGSSLYSGSGYKTTVPPIAVSLEHCFFDNLFDENSSIGIGGYAGYTAAKNTYTVSGWGEYGYKYTSFLIGARGVFHYQFVDRLDTYAGVGLGWNIVSSSTFGNFPSGGKYSASDSGLYSDFFIGARWYFTDSFAVVGEVGYGVAYLNLGVSLKF